MKTVPKVRIPKKGASEAEVQRVIDLNRIEAWDPSSPMPNVVEEFFAQETLRVRHPVTAYVNALLMAGREVPEAPQLRGQAYSLLYSDRMVERVSYLRQRHHESIKVTAETLAAELDQAIELAARLEDPRGMTTAIDTKRRCFGVGEKGSGAEAYVPPQRVVVEVVSASRE